MILSGTQKQPKVVTHERVGFPAEQSLGQALCWVRKQIAEILGSNTLEAASLKAIEPMARKKSAERIQIEGIIIEAVYSIARIECVPRIKSQLRRDIRDFKEPTRYLTRVLSHSGYLDELRKPNFEDATLAALAALPPA